MTETQPLPRASVSGPQARENFAMGYRPDIQGMRAFAVLAVVLYHAGVPFMPGGYVGVDVFFVISGFLITSIMASELERTSQFRLSRFYAKRILRIIPAATLVLVATTAATALWVPVTQWKAIASEVAASSIYVVNWQLAATTNYLNTEALPSPVQHFWSLAVEEQYYLLWPAAFVLVISVARVWSRQREFGSGTSTDRTLLALRLLPWVVLAVVIASLVFSMIAVHRWPSGAYFITPTRIWELGIGSLLAFTAHSLRGLPNWAKRVLTIGGLSSVLAAIVLYSATTTFPGAAALLPTLGTAAMLAGGLAASPASDSTRSTIFSHPVAIWFGNISYALYLWHWPILIVAEARLGELSAATRVALVLLAIVLAAASTFFFEQPMRSAQRFQASATRAFLLGATAIVLSLVAAGGLWTAAVFQDNASTAPDALGATALADGAIPPEVRAPLPQGLSPSLVAAASDNPRVYRDGCHLEPEEIEPRVCEYGGDGPLVLLTGDSHAAQWFPTLEPIAEEYGFRLVSMTKSSCPLADFSLATPDNDGQYVECEAWNKRVQDYISREKPALVITTALETYIKANSDDPSAAPLTEGFVESWQRIENNDVPVLVLADTPYMASNVPDCLALHISDPSQCRTKASQAFKAAGPLKEAASRQGAHFVDLNDRICPGSFCQPIIGDVLVYRDQHHLSATYARTLALAFKERADELLPRTAPHATPATTAPTVQ